MSSRERDRQRETPVITSTVRRLYASTRSEPVECSSACEDMHGDFSYHPFTYFTCSEAIAEVGHWELIFISCPYLSFLRKNSWSRVKTNSKGVPRQTKSEIDKGLNEKNRPVPIWWRALANWRRALARKSSYFDKIEQLSVGNYKTLTNLWRSKGFVERSHLLTAVSVVARA